MNFCLDGVLAALAGALLSTGLLLKFVLPGCRSGSVLGMDRHAWGEVHFWLSLAMLAALTLHLIWHRAWIAACWRRFVGSGRSVKSLALVALLVTVIVLPFLLPVERGTATGRGGGGRGFGQYGGYR